VDVVAEIEAALPSDDLALTTLVANLGCLRSTLGRVR
jgi:hypothetical protein